MKTRRTADSEMKEPVSARQRAAGLPWKAVIGEEEDRQRLHGRL